MKQKLKKLTGCNTSDDEEEEPDATSIIESEDEEEDHEEDVVDVGHESNSTLKKGSIQKSLSYHRMEESSLCQSARVKEYQNCETKIEEIDWMQYQ